MQQEELLKSVQSIHFNLLPSIPPVHTDKVISGYSALDICDINQIAHNKEIYESVGRSLIKEGQLAVLILAGGESSRLGFDHPKGMLNVGIKKHLYLFEIMINSIREVAKNVCKWIPIVIMTNPARHSEIIDFFETHSYFSYNEEKVGVLCNHNNRPTVVEYFEAEALMHETLSSGELKYKYGVILNYLFDLHELQKANADHMPIHLSPKKIPFCNHQGETVIPRAAP